MSTEPTRIAELRIAAEGSAWGEFGFAVDAARTRIGTTPIHFEGSGAGGEARISGWSLAGTEATDFDGLHTDLSTDYQEGAPPSVHPNGALAIDHVVAFTPELERTIDAFEAAGVRCRRVREVGPPDRPLRQAFFRFGEVICEVVEVPEQEAGPDGASRFWGLTVTVADLDRAAAKLGEHLGTPRDAVQEGRRIATARPEAGLGVPVALISPDPRRV